MMKDAGLDAEFEGTFSNAAIRKALSKASKRGTDKPGRPDIIAVSNGIPIVVEVKTRRTAQNAKDNIGDLRLDPESVATKADNGAVHYAFHILQNTDYQQAVAIGCTVSGKKAILNPYLCYFDPNSGGKCYTQFPSIPDFKPLGPENIGRYIAMTMTQGYSEVSENPVELSLLVRTLRTKFDKAVRDQDTRNILMGVILLARLDKTYSARELKADRFNTDANILLNHAEAVLKNKLKVGFAEKKNSEENLVNYLEVLRQLSADRKLNSPKKNGTLSPIGTLCWEVERFYQSRDLKDAGFLYPVFTETEYYRDYLEKARADTCLYCQAIITSLNPVKGQRLFVPYCGDGMFLVSTVRRLSVKTESQTDVKRSINNDILAMEPDPDSFATAATNMILLGAKTVNIINGSFPDDMGPFARKKMDYVVSDLRNRRFGDERILTLVSDMLDVCKIGGSVSVIVPISAISGSRTSARNIRSNILDHNRLDAIIRISEVSCILYFTAGKPHDKNNTLMTSHTGDLESIYRMISGIRDGKQTRGLKRATVDPEIWWINKSAKKIQTDNMDLNEYMIEYTGFRSEQTRNGYGSLFDNPMAPPKTFRTKTGNIGSVRIENMLFLDSGNNYFVDVDGEVPRVVYKKTNNGWSKMIHANGKVHRGNCITVGIRKGTVGRAQYQPCPFIASKDIAILRMGSNVSRYTLQYIACCINKQIVGNTSYIIDDSDMLLRISLNVPVKNGSADYDYMKNRMKLAESECLGTIMESLGLPNRSQESAETDNGDEPEMGPERSGPIFVLNYHGREVARGIPTEGNGFRVLAGSELLPKTRHLVKGNEREYDRLISEGVAIDGRFVKDWDASSPSRAVSVVLGSNYSGLLLWKLEDGTSLKEYLGQE